MLFTFIISHYYEWWWCCGHSFSFFFLLDLDFERFQLGAVIESENQRKVEKKSCSSSGTSSFLKQGQIAKWLSLCRVYYSQVMKLPCYPLSKLCILYFPPSLVCSAFYEGFKSPTLAMSNLYKSKVNRNTVPPLFNTLKIKFIQCLVSWLEFYSEIICFVEGFRIKAIILKSSSSLFSIVSMTSYDRTTCTAKWVCHSHKVYWFRFLSQHIDIYVSRSMDHRCSQMT